MTTYIKIDGKLQSALRPAIRAHDKLKYVTYNDADVKQASNALSSATILLAKAINDRIRHPEFYGGK